MYKIAFQVNLTDWMDRPDLLPMGQNVDWLMRGLVETPGREYQSSYNPLVRLVYVIKIFNERKKNLKTSNRSDT